MYSTVRLYICTLVQRIARVSAKNTSGADQRLYVELLCGSARLNTTKQATSDPWNQCKRGGEKGRGEREGEREREGGGGRDGEMEGERRDHLM